MRTDPRTIRPVTGVYILVADRTRARVFQAARGNGRLNEVADLVNPEGRLRKHEMLSDSPGRGVSGARGSRTSVEPRQDACEHVAEAFAKRVCKRLDAARTAGKFDRLYLVAQPEFLGYLRQNMGREMQRLVVKEIPKSVTRARPDAIRKALPARLT